MAERSPVFVLAGIKDIEFAGFQVAGNRFGRGERPALSILLSRAGKTVHLRF